jgi:hypothetical protein
MINKLPITNKEKWVKLNTSSGNDFIINKKNAEEFYYNFGNSIRHGYKKKFKLEGITINVYNA